MSYGRDFFDPCWTPIYPTNDQGEPMQIADHEHILSADCPCQPEREDYRDPAAVLERLVDELDRHPLSQRFWEKLLAAGEMHDRKQADYGREHDPFYNIKQSANWGVEPWKGALLRLDDKVGRLRNLAQRQGVLLNESVEDSLMDIAVYALISLVLYEEATIRDPSRAAQVTSLHAA